MPQFEVSFFVGAIAVDAADPEAAALLAWEHIGDRPRPMCSVSSGCSAAVLVGPAPRGLPGYSVRDLALLNAGDPGSILKGKP